MENEYINKNEALEILGNYTEASKLSILSNHKRNGNVKSHFPRLAIIDENGNILQEVDNNGQVEMYKRSEIIKYAKEKPYARAGFHRRAIILENEQGQQEEFRSITEAANHIGCNYYKLYAVINTSNMIKGYKVKSK